MKIEFGIAGAADDSAIRELLAANPMPGGVTVAFEREPDYFLGHHVMGDRCVTIRAVDSATGDLAGVICVASADRFINGAATTVGYIGQLRIAAQYRGLLIPLRAMRFVRELVSTGWPNIWFNALANENPEAVAIFARRPRPSFPPLELVTRIQTLGIYTRPAKTVRGAKRGIVIRHGDEVGLKAIVRFLRKQGPSREFFPLYTEESFIGERTPGFMPHDFLVALSGHGHDEIVGVCGVWDQSSFKQAVVHGYRGLLRRVRPVINSVGPMFGMKRLPGVGEQIKSAYLSFLAVCDDDADVFQALLSAALGAAHAQGKNYLLAGFSEQDPLLGVAHRYRHILYRSTMYAYTFDGSVPADAFDRSKIPYVEIAAL